MGNTTVALQRLTSIGNNTVGENPVGNIQTLLDLKQTEQVSTQTFLYSYALLRTVVAIPHLVD